jgi:pimeloyl-ACP methyl ester carboxylesterase
MNLSRFEALRRTVRLGSEPVGYVDVGDGPTALFLHGVGTNAALWRNVLGELSDERRCVAVDFPLHGRSGVAPDQDLSLTGLARFVADFCDALGLDDVDLVANDTGGGVAQVFAAQHPARLRSLTLTDCETHDHVPPEAFKPTVDLARAGLLAPGAPALLADLAAAREVVFAMGYQDVERLELDVVRSFLEPVLGTPGAAREFERLLCSLAPEDLLAVEPALRRLTVPTLVVWGTDDAFFPLLWARWLADVIPGVTKLVELEGGRLFFPEERAGDLVPHLREHWAAARPTVPSGHARA